MVAFLIAYAISASAPLLPCKRLVRLFEQESYGRPPFFAKLREDRAWRRGFLRYWLMSLGIEAALLAGILYLAFFVLNIPYSTVYSVALLALAAVFFGAMALLFRKWRKQGVEMRTQFTEQTVRLNIWMLLLTMLLHVLTLVLLAMLLSLISQWIPDFRSQTVGNYSPAYIAYELVVLLAPYLSLLLSQFLTISLLPRLLALAAIFSRAARLVSSEKKD